LKSTPKVGVVIPTRNRPDALRLLLESLTKSTIIPTDVAVVASGIDVANVVNDFAEKLSIKYMFSNQKGQVIQKAMAISILSSEIDWCLFIDDDLLVGPNAILEALKSVERMGIGQEIVGVGLAIPPTSRLKLLPSAVRLIAQWAGLDSEKKGELLRSGHGVSYLDSDCDIYTGWLNGASMWRIMNALDYSSQVPNTPIASCEDLVFSFSQSKVGRLIFSKSASLSFQRDERTNAEDYFVFISSALWRLYLVHSDPFFSRIAFLWAQFFRTVFVLLAGNKRMTAASIKYLSFYGYLFRRTFSKPITADWLQQTLEAKWKS
jgi:glycosyltransferase involved in cell wall biosynthesis